MKYLLTLILGVVVGGALAYFLLVGAPRAAKPPGEPVRAPEAGGSPPGTVVVTLDEQFFNTLLGTIFRDMGSPTFKLASAEPSPAPAGRDGAAVLTAASSPSWPDGARVVRTQGGCASQVDVNPEAAGVKTGVRLADGQIQAPLAFTGSYNVFGQCVNFTGWAQGDIQLRFDQNEQTLYGQVSVQSVNLEGNMAMFGGLVTAFVQNAINQRVNPIVLMRGQQIALNVPVQAANGTLRAQAKDIRAEIKDGALRLHLTYDFSGAGAQPQPPAG
ncbi:MAG TPA: hypothetical protein VER08_00515 [Pyrinomonadaceae bacterium]|nr:hypothetical protein [Pyrinomonadaceae bacterium]